MLDSNCKEAVENNEAIELPLQAQALLEEDPFERTWGSYVLTFDFS